MDKILPYNKVQSLFWMIIWAASFNIAMSSLKFLEHNDTFMVVFIRFLFGLVVIAPALIKSPVQKLRTQQWTLHAINAVLRCAGIFCTYYAYRHLPMAFAASIGFTAPFIAVTLALILLRERVELHKWIAVTFGYFGVLIMINPQEISVNIAILASLAANACAAFSQVVTKNLSKTESNIQIMFYINIGAVLLTSVIMVYQWEQPLLKDWPILLLIGAAGTISQYSFIKAIRVSDLSFVAPFEYIRLLFAVPIGILLFNELPQPLSILGSLIIVGCSGFLTYMEMQTNKQKKLQET